jgi:hypothetical protein
MEINLVGHGRMERVFHMKTKRVKTKCAIFDDLRKVFMSALLSHVKAKDRQDMKGLAPTLSASAALLLLLCSNTLEKRDDARWFSFGWTKRVGIPNALETISNAYKANKDTSPVSLNNLNMLIMESAYCKPVNLGGQLSWRGEDVSGLCKCLKHAHTEYVHAVCSPTTMQCVPEENMKNPQVRFAALHSQKQKNALAKRLTGFFFRRINSRLVGLCRTHSSTALKCQGAPKWRICMILTPTATWLKARTRLLLQSTGTQSPRFPYFLCTFTMA